MHTWTLTLVIGMTLATQASETDPFQEKQRAFLQQCQEIETKRKEASVPWPEQYERDLRTLEKRFQMDGDLESMLTVRQEQARFQKTSPPRRGLR